jgi:serralysin
MCEVCNASSRIQTDFSALFNTNTEFVTTAFSDNETHAQAPGASGPGDDFGGIPTRGFANEPTNNVAFSGVNYIDGVLAGTKFSGSALTFGFPTVRTDYEANYSDPAVNSFAPVSAAVQNAARFTFSMVNNFTNLSVTETATPADATFRLGMSTEPGTAYAYYPTTAAVGGDSWYGIGGGGFSDTQKGNYFFYTVVHELGHNLGLSHGHETQIGNGEALPSNLDGMEFSIMTYRSSVNATTAFVTNEQWGYASGFMMNDIAALQYMYGADFGYNGGNTTYSVSTTTGELFINGVGQGAVGANRTFLTVWDGGGSDTYDYSNYNTNQTIDLRAGKWSALSPVQIANLGAGEFAKGSVYNAWQYQGDARSLIENSFAGIGNDTMRGNQAANVLSGAAGDDSINGGSGNDTLSGGDGNDTLEGDYPPQNAVLSVPGIGFSGASVTTLTSSLTNTSSATALNLTQNFSLAGDANIINSTTIAHTSVISVGTGSAQWFKLDVAAGTELAVDIDSTTTLNSEIALFRLLPDGSAREMIRNDNASTTLGGAGSSTSSDSYFRYTTLSSTTYYVVVGTSGADTTLAAGSAFTLNISARGTLSEVLGDGGLEGNDVIDGGVGNDVIYGYGGNDFLVGGSGIDVVVGGTGNDTIILGDGDDVAYTQFATGTDYVYGGNGADSIYGNDTGTDILIGEAGNDLIAGSGGALNYIYGGSGNNVLSGGSFLDIFISEGATDIITSGDVRSQIYRYAAGSTTVYGGAGIDEFIGGTANSNDLVYGRGGNDYLFGGNGNDWLLGEGGNDLILGQGGNDTLDGGAGVNTIWANDAGSDYIQVRTSDAGTQVIEFFEAGGTNDIVQILGSNLTSFAGIATLRASLGTVIGGNVLYNAGSGAQLFLNVGASQTAIWFQGVSAFSLTNADFLFG